jgi:hypothetical protein
MGGPEERFKRNPAACRKVAEKHIERHAGKNAQGINGKDAGKRFEKRRQCLKRKIEKIGDFLEKTEKREGRNEKEIKSNVADNESAVIHSSKGFLQGYIGIAVSGRKRQSICLKRLAGTLKTWKERG